MPTIVLILTFLLFALPANASNVTWNWAAPFTEEYQAGEIYLIVPYHVENHESRAVRRSARWYVVTGEGRQVEESIHPLVEGHFCRTHSCPEGGSEHLHGGELMPGARMEAFAIMGPFSHPPGKVRLIAKEFDGTMWLNRECQLLAGGGYDCSPPTAPPKKKIAKH